MQESNTTLQHLGRMEIFCTPGTLDVY